MGTMPLILRRRMYRSPLLRSQTGRLSCLKPDVRRINGGDAGETAMRVLYIHGTVVPPSTDRGRDPFFLLSERLEGDVLQQIWFEKGSDVDAVLGPGSHPVY